jgi:glycosyltransferase involved in cell wall biosynthesis
VLQVITRLNIGGPARHVLMLGTGLKACGFEPLLVYGSKEPSEGSLEDELDGYSVPSIKLQALGRAVGFRKDLRVLWQLTRLLFAEQPDIVHTHTAKAGTVGRLAALFYNATRRRSERCAVIHTYHGHVFRGYFGEVGSRAVQMVERLLARLTDRVIAVSERQRVDICERYRIASPDHTEVIEVATDLDAFLRLDSDLELRAALGFSPEHVVFGYAGRFAPVKDLRTLVHAFAQVADRLARARLVLVGDGELRPSIERLVHDLGLSERVRFTGWVRDMRAIYGAIDVGVLTSLNEGTPLALIEAMAAGRPVVATMVGGVEDIVRHGKTGLLVPAGDVAALAHAMTLLGSDASLRTRLGSATRQSVAIRDTPDRVADRIAHSYTETLAACRQVMVESETSAISR